METLIRVLCFFFQIFLQQNTTKFMRASSKQSHPSLLQPSTSSIDDQDYFYPRTLILILDSSYQISFIPHASKMFQNCLHKSSTQQGLLQSLNIQNPLELSNSLSSSILKHSSKVLDRFRIVQIIFQYSRQFSNIIEQESPL